ncbi:hypothetical protein [Agrobacterium pusense]|uniref:hypothetical protein n=1 Tax=Agrobacterium pusense TaxID=648995 RepID=UPI002FDE959D
MFRDNTVFIIGAGASREFGLPVGEALMKQIQTNSRFRFDFGTMKEGIEPIFRCVVNRYAQDNDAINARFLAMAEIHRAIDHAGSIDEFINRHNGDEIIAEVGKLQIAYAISKAERHSKLAKITPQSDRSSEPDLSDTWIKPFTRMLFDGVRNSDVETLGNNITIICFNYDRCIETYLEYAIVKTFRDVSQDMARQIVKNINIIHPYGSLGDLRHHPFGAEPTPERIRAMSENIVTWSESMNSDISPKIQDAMTNASTVIFLGFAFAPQNMKLLEVENGFDGTFQEVETFATAYGYNAVINERLTAKIIDLFPSEFPTVNEDKVHIQYDMKCAEFLKAHSMALVV